MYFGISILISGVLPITIGIISVLSGDVNDYSSFCWIKSSTVLFIFIIIRFIIVIVFFILAGKLIFHMKEESKTGNMVDEIYILIKERITRYVYLRTYNTIVFVYYNALQIIHNNHWFGVASILNIITSPAFVLVFIFSNKGTLTQLKNILLCKKEETEKEQELMIPELYSVKK